MVNKLATSEAILNLKNLGFTWVSLGTGGVANKNKDIPISRLI